MNNISRIDEATLRRQAEARLARGDLPSKLALLDPMRMLHELQVHQIELQMQNEELMAANVRSEALREKYEALHACAPVAILTVTDAGRILEANRQAAFLFDVEDAASLVGASLLTFFDHRTLDSLSSLLSEALEKSSSIAEELELHRTDHHLPKIVQAQVRKLNQPQGAVLLIAMMDVTRTKQIQEDVATLLLGEKSSIREAGERND